MQQVARDIAQNMLHKGLSDTLISETTGLSLAAVAQLKHKPSV